MGFFTWLFLIGMTLYGWFHAKEDERLKLLIVYIIFGYISLLVGGIVGTELSYSVEDKAAARGWGAAIIWYVLTCLYDSYRKIKKADILSYSIVVKEQIRKLVVVLGFILFNIYVVSHAWFHAFSETIQLAYRGITQIVIMVVLNLIFCCIFNRSSKAYQKWEKSQERKSEKNEEKNSTNKKKMAVYQYLEISDLNTSFEVVKEKYLQKINQRAYKSLLTYTPSKKETSKEVLSQKKNKRYQSYQAMKDDKEIRKMSHLLDKFMTYSELKTVIFGFFKFFMVILLFAGFFDMVKYNASPDGLGIILEDTSTFLMFPIIAIGLVVLLCFSARSKLIFIPDVDTHVPNRKKQLYCAVLAWGQGIIIVITLYCFFAIGWSPEKLQKVGNESEIIGMIQQIVFHAKPFIPGNLEMTFVIPQ